MTRRLVLLGTVPSRCVLLGQASWLAEIFERLALVNPFSFVGLLGPRLAAVTVATIDSDFPDLQDSDARCDIYGRENLAFIGNGCRKHILIDLPIQLASLRKWFCVLNGVR